MKTFPSISKLVATVSVCKKLEEAGFSDDTHFNWVRLTGSDKWHLAASNSALETGTSEIAEVLPAPLEGELEAALPSWFVFEGVQYGFQSGVGIKGQVAAYARNDAEVGSAFMKIKNLLVAEAPRQADARALLWIEVKRAVPEDACTYIDYEMVNCDAAVRVVSDDMVMHDRYPPPEKVASQRHSAPRGLC